MIYDGLFGRLKSYFAGAGTAYVVAPFIRADVLSRLLADRREGAAVILTSWRPDHVLAGASDLDVYNLCRERQWTLYSSDRLHAKLYSLNLASAWIGSANITRRALGLVDVSNDEVLGLVDPLPADVQAWVFRLLHMAHPVTDELHELYTEWLAEQPPLPRPSPPPVAPSTERTPFSIGQLPATPSPRQMWEVLHAPNDVDSSQRNAAERDYNIYRVPLGVSYEEFGKQLAVSFSSHPLIVALLTEVKHASLPNRERPGLRFGSVKAWLYAKCTDAPAPHDETLTELVANVFAWCQELLPSVVEITRPRHTQVIRALV